MSTTTVFVEILIIGMQSVSWIFLVILGLVGYDWVVTTYLDLNGWANWVTIVLLALCYTIGIIVDRLADALFMLIQPKKVLLKSEWVKHKFEEVHTDARMAVLLKESKAIDFLEYARSRIRIVRATLLNLLLGMIAGVFLTLKRVDSLGGISKWSLVLIILGVGSLLGLVIFIALGMLQITYDTRLEQADAYRENVE